MAKLMATIKSILSSTQPTSSVSMDTNVACQAAKHLQMMTTLMITWTVVSMKQRQQSAQTQNMQTPQYNLASQTFWMVATLTLRHSTKAGDENAHGFGLWHLHFVWQPNQLPKMKESDKIVTLPNVEMIAATHTQWTCLSKLYPKQHKRRMSCLASQQIHQSVSWN